MENGGRCTLTTLLNIKKRRERRIRNALAMLDQQDASLFSSKSGLLEERRVLWVEWSARANADAVHDFTSLQDLKCDLAGFHDRDQTLANRILEVDALREALSLERESQLAQLHVALVDQEKLNSLLE